MLVAGVVEVGPSQAVGRGVEHEVLLDVADLCVSLEVEAGGISDLEGDGWL